MKLCRYYLFFLRLATILFIQNLSFANPKSSLQTSHPDPNPSFHSIPPTNGYLAPDSFESEDSRYKLLVFLSEKCPCSRSHIRHIKNLMNAYPDLKVYGVISEPAKNKKQKDQKNQYFLKTDFGFPIIEDTDQLLVKKYKALKTPHVVLVKQEIANQPAVIYQGGLTDSKIYSSNSKKYLETAMNESSNGKDVKVKNGFCMGCYIRRF